MFSAYILHTWAKPYLTRENVPQTFFDIVNADAADVSLGGRGVFLGGSMGPVVAGGVHVPLSTRAAHSRHMHTPSPLSQY
jgi:hypothetical protein